jgi:hypothetical protein
MRSLHLHTLHIRQGPASSRSDEPIEFSEPILPFSDLQLGAITKRRSSPHFELTYKQIDTFELRPRARGLFFPATRQPLVLQRDRSPDKEYQ